MTKDAPGVIYEMDHWGCPFSRFDDGRIAQRPFGGAGYPRTCYGADKTGHYLLHTLVERAYEREVKMYIEVFVTSLIVDEGRCRGVVAYDMINGGFHAFTADAVVMATGGAGRIYGNSTNAIISTGGGAAIAYQAGVPAEGHGVRPVPPHGPAHHAHPHDARPAAARAATSSTTRASASWRATRPRPWSWRRATSPRARSPTEINEGRGIDGEDYVHLDLRHLGAEKILERLPGIRDIAIHFEGVDPIEEPIPIRPVQHYSMGGIDTDVDGRTRLPGFYAAGECACVSVHGANRLGGNSLLETIVFGRRAGMAVAADLESGAAGGGDVSAAGAGAVVGHGGPGRRARRPRRRRGRPVRHPRRDDRHDARPLRRVPRGGGHADGPRDACAASRSAAAPSACATAGGVFNLDLMRTLELEGMVDLALGIAEGALARTESRGSHSRTDYPARDDEHWLKHTLAYYSPEGPRLEYEPVTLGTFEPQERKY